MKIEIWMTGKTAFPYLEEGIRMYEKRINAFIPFSIVIYPDIKFAKNLAAEQLKVKEGAQILSKLQTDDWLILADENGQQMNSVGFSEAINKTLHVQAKRIIFLIGGAYGFSEDIYKRANGLISLSKMTFSHQIARLMLAEQLYRAITIMKGHPYHNE